MESVPQIAEFRNNPENFHPCNYYAQFDKAGRFMKADSEDSVRGNRDFLLALSCSS